MKSSDGALGLTDLPAGLLLDAIFCHLDASDLMNVMQGIPSCRPLVENKVFIKHFLVRERLPGDSIADFIHHMEQWSRYKSRLRRMLFQIVFPSHHNAQDSTALSVVNNPSPQTRDAVRSFLRDAIFNFTNRAAGCQPWYEILPLGPGNDFEFVLDLTANMRRSDEPNGGWREMQEGDGTRVLPTWLSTNDYRKEYGFFQFQANSDRTERPQSSTASMNRYLIVHDFEGREYYVPGSCRPEPVMLTGVLHRAASGLNMYTRILQRAVEAGRPEKALKVLTPEMLPSASWFRHMFLTGQNRPEQKLPTQAALEMQERAHELLGQQNQSVSQAQIWANANQVLLRQQRREWNSISYALWKLCHTTYGSELTPPLHEMFEPPSSTEPNIS